MIVLQKFGPHFGVPDPSPFVLKLETFLRLSNIDYKTEAGDVRKAPKGKMPCIIIDGEVTADSQFAIAELKKKFNVNLNSDLTEAQLAEHHMLRLALENHTYFMALAFRWLHEKNAPLIQKAFFGPMGFMGKIVFKIVQKGMRRTVHGQGILRHSWDELDDMIAVDVNALEKILGDKAFFGGDEPTEIDATTFAFIANMLVPELDTPFLTHSRKSQPLIDYHNRMTERVYPDYKETMLIK